MCKIINAKVFVLILIFAFDGLKAQQNILYSNDVFSGINGSTLSPMQSFMNPNPWDVQIFSEDLSVLNDYAYISQQSLLGLTNADIKTANPKTGIRGSNTANVLDFYDKNFANFHLSSDLMGPSFSMKAHVGEKEFRVGLFSRLRTQASVKDFDNYLRFQNEDLPKPADYFLQPINTSFMNWGELGLNFSTRIFEQSEYQWIVGFNLKYEAGFDAYNLQNRDDLELKMQTNSLGKEIITATQYNIATSYATNYNFDKDKYEFKQQGKGFGVDFGIAFVNQYPDAESYDFKMILNVLDVGYVQFKNGINHEFVGNKRIDLEGNPAFENVNFDSPEEFLQTLSTQVYGNSNASLRSPGFKIGLPTSLNFGLSKNLKDHHYLNFNWVQRMPVFENSLLRMNEVMLSYSVQKKAFAYGVSTALYEYNNLQFGGYVRVGPLILGSDNILPMFFNHKKLHAANFFIGLKLYPFWDDDLKRHRREKCNCD